jgi:hypothetical protein
MNTPTAARVESGSPKMRVNRLCVPKRRDAMILAGHFNAWFTNQSQIRRVSDG